MRRMRLQEKWDHFRRSVMPESTDPVLLKHYRRVFLAGAASGMEIITSIDMECEGNLECMMEAVKGLEFEFRRNLETL